ncbi:MAG: sorbosone dehydrogenase family protein [Bacteroidia bacterium]|nr:sorbosone dehydrogenase family protein [Bacteroidia bacterium]
MHFLGITALFCALQLLMCSPAPAPTEVNSDPRLKLPPGFAISVFAKDVPGARQMALGNKGTIFVGNRGGGKVYAVCDENGDHLADKVWVIAKGLNSPNGVAFRDGSLYVAEISRILRFDQIEDHLVDPPSPVVVYDKFPTDKMHGWKYIAFGPDGKLYVPVGAPCNICNPEEEIYSTITRMDPNGSNPEIFAHGIRNTVGFSWHPETKELWFTDNGRDWLGDDAPNDELNHAPQAGMHFGYPFCHQGDTPDPEFGDAQSCDKYVKPAQKLGPHVAALGVLFYTGSMFPAEYRNRLLIAQHGSWNRSTPIGYRVMMIETEGGKVQNYQPFVTGWLQGSSAWGRPVALLQLPDGSVLLSDDEQGLIYRITYQK